jgi:choice-of-anchor B domain-containing protein
MYRLLLLSLLLTAGATTLFAQAFNTTLRDNLDYAPDLNDVWGYVAPDGTEYALVGLRNGLSIVSLADPDNIAEVAFIGGTNSTWRDIKTYGTHAYVVADSGSDGILSVDLSNLPTSVTSQFYNSNNTPAGDLTQAHNIYIDETEGLAYISGSDRNSGGMVLYDVATTPGVPAFVSFAPAVYAHDVYVQDDIMYASEIFAGDLTLYNVADPQNISEIGSTGTPFDFTHNAWTDATGDYVYTTDERGNAPVAAYDISNPADIQLLDEFRPNRSIDNGTIPHNVHVQDDYLIISYYTDGVEIVDATDPSNMVEVAYYDSWAGGDGGFNGSWGAYPFLPSGLVLSSDISGGLYVIEVNYQRAARLRGTITDEDTGANLNNVSVTITSPLQPSTNTLATGKYKTGTPETGTFMVTYSLAGYENLAFPLDFVSGEEIVQDTFLTLKSVVNVIGDVTSTVDNSAISGAEVRLVGDDGTYEDVSNGSGAVSFNSIVSGAYQAYAGIWGFEDKAQAFTAGDGSNVSFQLTPGFQDGFELDQGWSVSGDAGTGAWERGVPNGTSFDGNASNPGADTNGDVGTTAYVTGNGGGGAGSDDIDGGTTTLTSPVFDPADVGDDDVLVSFDYWFFNDGGSTVGDDMMEIIIDNGSQTEVVMTYTTGTAISSAWTAEDFLLSDLSIPLTTTMQFVVTIGDTGGGHLVEGGLDNFKLTALATLPVTLSSFTAQAMDKQVAQLNWTTSTEVNSSHFLVQRSADGAVFETIGSIAAAGNSDAFNRYNFADEQALIGNNFYRLEQLDLDGSAVFSNTLLVQFTAETGFTVSPNPTADYLQLSVIPEGPVTVFSADGRAMKNLVRTNGNQLDVSLLKPGQYWIRVGEETVPFTKH